MDKLEQIRHLALKYANSEPFKIPRFGLYSSQSDTELAPLIYSPVVCLVVQGEKRTVIGNKVLRYSTGECLVVASEVIAMGQILGATDTKPYLSLSLNLDPGILSPLIVDVAGVIGRADFPSFGVTTSDERVVDVWYRLIELLDRPNEIPLLAQRFEEELLLRLLLGPLGPILIQVARSDSSVSRIRHAMSWIRERHTTPLSIEEMAQEAGMSVPTFHRRFKAVTALSPLQYQKQIQLYEARKRLVTGNSEAAEIAFSVGYESPSQFSREYKRLFGLPPKEDAKRMQSLVASSF